jgi:hypothetical protein
MESSLFKKCIPPIIVIGNIAITVLYFNGESSHSGDVPRNITLVVSQFIINCFMGVLFGSSDGNPEENNLNLSRPFFLSALLCLLIGLGGLCTSN